MQYIYNEQTLTLKFDVYKGVSDVKEAFNMANVGVFLVYGTDRFRIPVTNVYLDEYGTIVGSVVGIPDGVYSVKIVWLKNKGRSPMLAEDTNAFAITSNQYEATNPDADNVTMRLTMHTASYGYDGLDAYELSYLRRKTNKTEEEWLEWMNGQSSAKRVIDVKRTDWVITFDLYSGETKVTTPQVQYGGGSFTYVATAKRTKTTYYDDGTQDTPEEETATIVPTTSANGVTISANTITIAESDGNERNIVISAEIGGIIKTKSIKQLQKASISIESITDGVGIYSLSEGAINVHESNVSINLKQVGDCGAITVTKTGNVVSSASYASGVVSLVIASNADGTAKTGDSASKVTIASANGGTIEIIVNQLAWSHDYGTPQVTLSYSPNPIAVTGGTASPSISYTQSDTKKYSDGRTVALSAITSGGTVTYSGTKSVVANDGKVTAGNNTTVTSSNPTIDVVTATVTLNGKSGTSTAVDVKQTKYVAPAEDIISYGAISLTETQAIATDTKDKALALITSSAISTMTTAKTYPASITVPSVAGDYMLMCVIIKDSTKKPQYFNSITQSYDDLVSLEEILDNKVNGDAVPSKSGWYAFAYMASKLSSAETLTIKFVSK